jgi:hypothetical protein
MHRPLPLLPLAGAFVAASLPALAQDDGLVDRVPERCITLMRLDRTEVIDDRTIIFHMRGGRIYLNHLSRECPGLKREERFMYSPTSNRLCDVDQVTVLEQWGFGLTRGFTCSLGMFHPINLVELEELRQGEEGSAGVGRRGGRGGFEVVPVDPDDDTSTDEQAGDEEPGGSAAPGSAEQTGESDGD